MVQGEKGTFFFFPFLCYKNTFLKEKKRQKKENKTRILSTNIVVHFYQILNLTFDSLSLLSFFLSFFFFFFKYINTYILQNSISDTKFNPLFVKITFVVFI